MMIDNYYILNKNIIKKISFNLKYFKVMQAVSYGSEYDDIENLYDSESLSGIEGFDYENDYENYYADQQHCYDGTEQHPEFTSHHSLPKNQEKSIKSDLKKIGFPVNIISEADDIYSKLDTGTKRGKRRKQMMFFCVKTAYNKLGIPEDPNKIANMCGIARSDISKAQSMCSRTKTNYKAPLVHHEPEDFLKIYYRKIQDLFTFSENTMGEIMEMCDEIMEKDEELEDEKPQTVAAAIIVFYLAIHGYSIEKKRYKEIFGSSDMTVNKVKNKVRDAYNS